MFLVAGSHVDPSADPSADPDPRWSAPPAAAGRPALRTRGLGADSARNSRIGRRVLSTFHSRNLRVLTAKRRFRDITGKFRQTDDSFFFFVS